jgi:hypothetical protein
VTLFRNAFLTLSHLAPILMLAVIAGLATIVSYMAMMLNADKNQIEADKIQIKALRASNAARSPVVYALRDIKEGAEVSSSDLEEREIQASKVPEDALTSSSLSGAVAGPVFSFGGLERILPDCSAKMNCPSGAPLGTLVVSPSPNAVAIFTLPSYPHTTLMFCSDNVSGKST